MSAVSSRILICTTGAEPGLPAGAFGGWLAGLLEAKVRVLGIAEKPDRQAEVDSAVQDLVVRLRRDGLQVTAHVSAGNPKDVVCAAAGHTDAITVLGRMGRPPLRRLVRGGTFRDLLACVASPVVYVPAWKPPVRRILLCSGGLAHAAGIERVTIDIARRARAGITLLHIVEPIGLDYPLARRIEENWQALLETDTPHARNLGAAVAHAEEAGVELTVKVRRGNPVREILSELRTETYGLVGMGSPHSTRSLRHLFLPNVTAEVAERASCPVLAARAPVPGRG